MSDSEEEQRNRDEEFERFKFRLETEITSNLKKRFYAVAILVAVVAFFGVKSYVDAFLSSARDVVSETKFVTEQAKDGLAKVTDALSEHDKLLSQIRAAQHEADSLKLMQDTIWNAIVQLKTSIAAVEIANINVSKEVVDKLFGLGLIVKDVVRSDSVLLGKTSALLRELDKADYKASNKAFQYNHQRGIRICATTDFYSEKFVGAVTRLGYDVSYTTFMTASKDSIAKMVASGYCMPTIRISSDLTPDVVVPVLAEAFKDNPNVLRVELTAPDNWCKLSFGFVTLAPHTYVSPPVSSFESLLNTALSTEEFHGLIQQQHDNYQVRVGNY